MKQILSILLVLALIVSSPNSGMVFAADVPELETIYDVEFTGLGDPELVQYVQDTVYAELEGHFNSDDYVVQDVNVIYISKEYLEELEYNSKTNIFFGYSLADIEEQFQGTKYVFTLGDNGETVVQPMEVFADDTFERVIKNVAIGTGIILICVTISVASGGLGFPVVSSVFAASAETATSFAISSSIISGVAAGIVEGIETNNFESAIKAGAIAGSEGFKWGAISGAVVGGASKAIALGRPIPSPREAELQAVKYYKGQDQVSYLAGEEVSTFTLGATRPDVVVIKPGGLIEAIEVKDYNLLSNSSKSTLKKVLMQQVSSRVKNLPPGSTQRIVLNIQGRRYSQAVVDMVREWITEFMNPIYPNIPIDFMGAIL